MPTTHEPASILIVDDDPGTLQSIGDVLERRGHAVRTATQARAALELLTDRSVDAAILDLHLPDVSGLVLLQAIKTAAPATEVIIITDQASATTAIEAINSGAFGYVTKPFKMDHLMATIDKALAKQRAERALWERTRSLETLIDARPRRHRRAGCGGARDHLSRAAERCSAEGTRGARPLVPTIPDARRAEFDEAAARNLQGEATLYESHRRRKDGTLIDVLSSTAPIIDAEGLVSGTLAVIIDITERKQLEEQLRQAMKLEGIARLAGGISHDFNNLMTVISVRCHLVLGQLPADHPNRRDIKIIGDAGDRAASLTRQLLAFSRSQILDATVLDINDVISDMKALLEPVLREDVDLIMDLDPSTGQVTADRGQLEQIILILAINARDAMPEGGQFTIGTRNVELDDARTCGGTSTRVPAPHVVLTVSDSGTGMDAATRGASRALLHHQGYRQGQGAGLAAAYGIIHQSQRPHHGGQ
jgi:PAS domain S-box-containing protein